MSHRSFLILVLSLTAFTAGSLVLVTPPILSAVLCGVCFAAGIAMARVRPPEPRLSPRQPRAQWTEAERARALVDIARFRKILDDADLQEDIVIDAEWCEPPDVIVAGAPAPQAALPRPAGKDYSLAA